MVSLGGRVRQLRAEQDWSTTELARRAGISPGYVSKIETGAAPWPSPAVLGRLARALGTTVADLLDLGSSGEPVRVPESLRRFAEQAQLADDEARMLAGISYRGRQPRTPEDWGFLWQAIKLVVRDPVGDR